MCNSFKFLGGSALWRGSGWILLCNVSALQLLRASQLQQGEEEEMQLTALFRFSSSSLLWPLGQASVDDEAPGERSVSREHSFRIQARPKKQPAAQPEKAKIANLKGNARCCLRMWSRDICHNLRSKRSFSPPISFQLNLHLNAPTGDLASFVMNGEWMILGKTCKNTRFQFCRVFQLFLDLLWIWPSIADPCLIHLLKYLQHNRDRSPSIDNTSFLDTCSQNPFCGGFRPGTRVE